MPWSYFMNVCTHSYSLVWYNWAQWEALIDWMALHGINNVLAMTGQEEMQYKVFTALGLNDTTIRSASPPRAVAVCSTCVVPGG